MVADEHLARMRHEYTDSGLAEGDLASDWLTQFRRWLGEAESAGLLEPNAMVLATASTDGVVSSRSVLAKDVDDRGITFFTNYESTKSRAMDVNPQVAVTFPWYGLHRQIQVQGRVERVSREATAAYWALRPRGSQLGAWASPQSRVVGSRGALDALQHEIAARFGASSPIPPPPHWGGWLIRPQTVEFWQGRRDRLHDRLRYRRTAEGWLVERLGS